MSDWKPFESFLEYLKVVRQASEATRAEMITAFVMTAKWLAFQDGDKRLPSKIPSIRQAMDVRNRLHNSAHKTRSEKTEDELKAEGKWLQWDEFLRATQKIRQSFMDSRGGEEPTLASARELHDLLLLSFLSTMPSRSSELRLLETVSWEDVMQQKPAKLSLKQFVAAQKRNILVKQPSGEYIAYLANYKMFWKKVSATIEFKRYH